jgi:hypothetical protein
MRALEACGVGSTPALSTKFMNETMRKYHRDWYHANKTEVGPRKYAREKKHRRFVRHLSNEVKLFMGCKQCGYNAHPKALEFHHRDPKTKDFNVSAAVSGIGIVKFLTEISKCDILCANCHAIFHATESSDSGSLHVSDT